MSAALNLAHRDGEPDWLATLRAECAKTSISDVARRIGYKRPSVSLALSGTYPGRTDKIATAVLKHLVGRVSCPAQGQDITADDCAEWAAKPFAATNSQRVAMYRACQSCPNRPKGGPDVE